MATSTAFDFTIGSAYGNKLPSELHGDGTYEKLEKGDEIPADEQLSSEDILKVVNDARLANARQKEMSKVLKAAGIEAPKPNDPVVVRRNFVRSLVLSGVYTEETAQAFADVTLGVSFGK